MSNKENFRLDGKIALVTGATYGIGFAIAKALAHAGAKIVFNDLKQEFVDRGLASYKAEGIDAKGYVCDVTDESAVNEMVAKIEREVGNIDILVNNAGIIKRIPMIEMSAADFRSVIDVDLNAPFIVAKAVIPTMIKMGHGKIINICSMISFRGGINNIGYAASKHAVAGITKNFANELGKYHIQVNGIAPGYIAAGNSEEIIHDEAIYNDFLSRIPAGRWGTPADLQGLAVFLSSEASDYINGAIIPVDGGYLCR